MTKPRSFIGSVNEFNDSQKQMFRTLLQLLDNCANDHKAGYMIIKNKRQTGPFTENQTLKIEVTIVKGGTELE